MSYEPSDDAGRVLRGGGWHDGSRLARAGYRNADDAASRVTVAGFRPVKAIPKATAE